MRDDEQARMNERERIITIIENASYRYDSVTVNSFVAHIIEMIEAHTITERTGTDAPQPVEHDLDAWIQPVCSCGWEGRKHHAHNDWQWTNYLEDVQRHKEQTT